ncbi:hypothetical protein [Tellurirhabdus bombi]|uniref:hypothetical protein n=1 Tax=Tellurirhabdus bombi TaxID=2907205 RepID=UPI001F2DB541|nr:hypothetical protein [Tellurirhabdus bombi]
MSKENERFEVVFDKIHRAWDRGEDLPLAIADRLKRWKAAREYFLSKTYMTDSQIVERLADDFRISEGLAWRDVRDAKRFFASTEQVNKEFDIIMLNTRIRKLEDSADSDKVKAACHANLIKLNGYDKPQNVEEGSKQIILNIDFNPALIGAKPIPKLEQTVERFIGEKAKRELMIEDVDFEDITDERDTAKLPE